jgi:hypothetical protein
LPLHGVDPESFPINSCKQISAPLSIS